MEKPLTSAAARPVAEPEDGLPTPRRYWSLLAVLLAMAMAVLDGTIVNVALPRMAHELHVSAATSIWVINAYQLAIAVTLLPLATLGDKIGYRQVYLAGLVVFTLGSLGCALSHTLESLTLARVAQGAGAGAVLSITTPLVRFTYPRRLLGHVIGLNAMVLSATGAAGPSLGAAIVSHASWEWLFAINVPLGVAAIGIGVWALPRTVGTDRPFDWASAVLNGLACAFLGIGAAGAARAGVASAGVALTIGAIAGAMLVYRELRIPAPLVPVDLMRIPVIGLTVGTAFLATIAQTFPLVGLPFYLQDVLGRSPLETGIVMTPFPLASAIGAPLGGRFADRYPAGVLGAGGLAVFTLGLLGLVLLPANPSSFALMWPMTLCGLGFSFFQATNSRAMIAATPMERSGAIGGLLSGSRLLAQTCGTVGMVLFFHLLGHEATRTSMVTGTVLAVIAALVTFSRLGRPRQDHAGRKGAA